MNISIICIGRLKERYWADAANEYMKRLGAYCEPAVIELRESRIHGSGEAAETKVKEEEGRSILSKITVDMYVMTLEIKGRSLSSEQFADKINAPRAGGQEQYRLCHRREPRTFAGGHGTLRFQALLFRHDVSSSDDEGNTARADIPQLQNNTGRGVSQIRAANRIIPLKATVPNIFSSD